MFTKGNGEILYQVIRTCVCSYQACKKKNINRTGFDLSIKEHKYNRTVFNEWEEERRTTKLRKEFKAITNPVLLRLTRRNNVGRTAKEVLVETRYLM